MKSPSTNNGEPLGAAIPPLLAVENLTVDFPIEGGVVHAVRGMSWTLEPGEVLAVVGEPGAGKSAAALALLGLLPQLRWENDDKSLRAGTGRIPMLEV